MEAVGNLLMRLKYRNKNIKYNELINIITKENLNNMFGNGEYLIRLAQKRLKIDKINFKNWEEFYFHSGEIRNEVISSSPIITFEQNNFYGRTENELLLLGQKIMEDYSEIKIPSIQAMDLSYSLAIDDPFLKFVRDYKIKDAIEQRWPEYKIVLSDEMTFISYSIDFIAYKNEKELFAIKIVKDIEEYNNILPSLESFILTRDIPIYYVTYTKNTLKSNIE